MIVALHGLFAAKDFNGLLILRLFIGKDENSVFGNTVEPQWLEHHWDHGNSFETWVVRGTEG